MSSSEEDYGLDQLQTDENVEDSERTAIRAELSSMTFEQLQKLKERIGAKVYNEAIFGTKKSRDEKPKVFKRENKNRPREMSSKKPVPIIVREVAAIKKKEVRDPRFDPLCGEFDKKQFANDYNFISDIRIQDIKAIKAELKETTDPDRETKLRRLLQRLNEQHRNSKKERQRIEREKEEKAQVEHEFKDGNLPHFKNKSERRVEALVQQYEELKKQGSGRIQRHLKRRQQKVKKKSNRPPTQES